MISSNGYLGAERSLKDRMEVSITQTFTLPSPDAPAGATTSQTFDGGGRPVAIGLPPGTDPSRALPGSWEYTGMHDHGPFLPPREGGPAAVLVGCADLAKAESDRLLSEVIEREKAEGGGGRKRPAASDPPDATR